MSFNDDIKKLARKLAITEAKAVAAFCINISRRVDNMSPVDTGLFRANWQASLDQPYTGATGRQTDKEVLTMLYHLLMQQMAMFLFNKQSTLCSSVRIWPQSTSTERHGAS